MRQEILVVTMVVAAYSRDTNLSFVLDRPSQSYEVHLPVCMKQACRAVICVRSADHVQPRIGQTQGRILIREKKDLVGRHDRPGTPSNRVMSPHMDYAVAPLFDIVVLGAKSPGEVPFHRAFADGSRLARELEPREDKRAADVPAGRLCCKLLSRGSQVRNIRRCRQLTLRTSDEERSEQNESEGRAPTAHTTSRVGRSDLGTNVPGYRYPARDARGRRRRNRTDDGHESARPNGSRLSCGRRAPQLGAHVRPHPASGPAPTPRARPPRQLRRTIGSDSRAPPLG